MECVFSHWCAVQTDEWRLSVFCTLRSTPLSVRWSEFKIVNPLPVRIREFFGKFWNLTPLPKIFPLDLTFRTSSPRPMFQTHRTRPLIELSTRWTSSPAVGRSPSDLGPVCCPPLGTRPLVMVNSKLRTV